MTRAAIALLAWMAGCSAGEQVKPERGESAAKPEPEPDEGAAKPEPDEGAVKPEPGKVAPSGFLVEWGGASRFGSDQDRQRHAGGAARARGLTARRPLL